VEDSGTNKNQMGRGIDQKWSRARVALCTHPTAVTVTVYKATCLITPYRALLMVLLGTECI
jgi:hypothetical protein